MYYDTFLRAADDRLPTFASLGMIADVMVEYCASREVLNDRVPDGQNTKLLL